MTLPWLTQPVMLHGSRDPGECTMTPEQCAYKYRWWVFWYEADHRYALPTVAFFLVAIIIFTFLHLVSLFAPRGWRTSGTWKRAVAIGRWVSYKSWRLGNWNTHSLGTYLLGAVGAIFFLAMMLGPRPYYWPNTMELSYGDSPPIATRSGWMALGCLPFIVILGTKANPIATLIGTSHEKLIVWHNWIAWAMLVLALVHTFPFVVYNIWYGDIVEMWNMDGLWLTGVIALIAQAWLTFMSVRWIRERYYEFFKATHFFFGLVFVIFFFLHCDFILTSWDYFIAASVLYTLSWLYSQCRTYMEHGFRHRARLNMVTNEMIKISIDTKAQWAPGQHIYLRFLSLRLHSLAAHPFTICSSSTVGKGNQMVFYAKPRGGLTGHLAKLATKEPSVTIPVLFDGPYGGVTARWYQSFDQTLVVGGGAGSGFTLSLVEDFLLFKGNRGQGAHMTVIVATRDPVMRDWYLDALGEMAARKPDREEDITTSGLSVQIYETNAADFPTTSNTDLESRHSENKDTETTKETSNVQAAAVKAFEVKFFKGRPDLTAATKDMAATQDATVGLVVCGPASMAHDMSQAAASVQKNIIKASQGAREVWLHKESFSS